MSIEEIMDVNGIGENRLKVGQNLYLPEPDLIGKKLARIKPETKVSKDFKSEPIFHMPVLGPIVRNFSTAKDNPYDGIAIKAPLGTKVKAALDGQVIFVGNDGNKFGLLIILEHQNPYITVYTQLDEAKVHVGQKIKRGEVLGTVGRSGGAKSPHLHFQIRIEERPEDPKKYLKL